MKTPAHRIALALGAIAFCASVSAAQAPRAASTPHEKLARAIYGELVGINTADGVGSPTRAARAIAKRFLDAGFPSEDVKIILHPDDSTRGNLVVRYRGTGKSKAKPILLLAHIDVVAALKSDWPRDPFTLFEENGFFYGRGSADDKAMASMFVANLLQYKAEGWKPDRDLILALTAGEESGETNGVELLIAKHRDLIDAEYAINEGGGGLLVGEGMNVRPVLNSIQAAEKVPENFTLTVHNPGGHSSVPRPDNAIYSLANGLVRLSQFTFPVAVNPVTRSFFEANAKVEQRPDMAAAMRAIVANPADSAAAAKLSTDPLYASTLRTTCVATLLNGGHADNALPQTATANVNCRIAPTSSDEETMSTLVRVLADTSISVAFRDPVRELFPKSADAVKPVVLAAVTDLTKKMFGDIPVVPAMSTGATDGRFLRAAGIPTYGVSGIFALPRETNAHGRDEKLRTKSYYDGLAFLDALTRRLASK